MISAVRRPADYLRPHDRVAWVVVVSTALIGAILRVTYALSGGLWRDEAQALGIAAIPSAGEMIRFLAAHESHPPLYYLILRGWVSVLGGSDVSALALSLVFGVALIPAVYLVTAAIHSPRAGVLASVLSSVHPGLIQYSGSVRPYSLLSFLAVILVYLVWCVLREQPKPKHLLGYAVVALAMLYVHHWAWLVVGAGGLVWLAIGLKRRGVYEVRNIALAHLGVGIAYSPWVPSLLHQVRSAGHPRVGASAIAATMQSLFAITWVPPAAAGILLGTSLWVYLSWGRGQSNKDQRLALGIAASIPILAAAMTVLLSPFLNLVTLWCYSIVSGPYLIAVSALISQHGDGKSAVRSWALGVAWVVVSAAIWFQLQAAPRSNVRDVANRMQTLITGNDRVVVVPGYVVPAFYRYLGPGQRVSSLPEDSLAPYIAYDSRVARDLDPRPWVRLMAMIDSSKGRCERVWVVVEAGTPPHLLRLVAGFLEEARGRLGPPNMVDSSPPRPGALEHANLRVYHPCTRTPGLPQ